MKTLVSSLIAVAFAALIVPAKVNAQGLSINGSFTATDIFGRQGVQQIAQRRAYYFQAYHNADYAMRQQWNRYLQTRQTYDYTRTQAILRDRDSYAREVNRLDHVLRSRTTVLLVSDPDGRYRHLPRLGSLQDVPGYLRRNPQLIGQRITLASGSSRYSRPTPVYGTPSRVSSLATPGATLFGQ